MGASPLCSHDDALLIVDPADGTIVDANTRAVEYYGWPRTTLLGMRLADLAAEAPPADQNLGQPAIHQRHRLANGRHREVELYCATLDGSERHYCIVHDVTRRNNLNASLSFLNRQAMVLLELPQLADALDEADFLRQALLRVEELTGSRLACLCFVDDDGQVGRRWCTQDACDELWSTVWNETLHRRQPLLINDGVLPGGGQSSLPRLIVLPVIEAGKPVMLIGAGGKASDYGLLETETLQLLANDIWRIVDHRRSELALRDALRVVEASPVVSIRWLPQPGWPVDFVSSNVSRWGYRDRDLMTGRPVYAELVHPEDLPRIASEVAAHIAAGCDEYVQHYRLRAGDGHYFWVEDTTRVIRDAQGQVQALEGVVSDDDARKRYELELAENLAQQRELNRKLEEAHNQLLQSEKMASIGQLAAGVAHELNNPIGFVSSNLGSLESYLRDLFAICDAYAEVEQQLASPAFAKVRALKEAKDFDFLRSDIFPLLAESKEGLSRVARIVKDLKDFSRAGEAAMQWADLHEGLESTLNIVWNELKYKCTVVKEYGALPRIWCVPAQLNQVFMNLLVNAAQAIAEKGTITLRTGQQDDEVFVAISDTGSGIAPEHLNRIFEPFFTTKPVGQGTGLGLSLAWSIVQKHHGRIEVASTLGAGTTFTVWLPVRDGENSSDRAPLPSA